jgi:hypothetical protein
MRRNNKLKISDAVRRDIGKQIRSGEIQGVGQLAVNIKDMSALRAVKQEIRDTRKVQWSYQPGDMVRFVDYWTGKTQMGMVVKMEAEGVVTVSSPNGLQSLSVRSIKLVDRLDDPCE